jgi:hypothetical protein
VNQLLQHAPEILTSSMSNDNDILLWEMIEVRSVSDETSYASEETISRRRKYQAIYLLYQHLHFRPCTLASTQLTPSTLSYAVSETPLAPSQYFPLSRALSLARVCSSATIVNEDLVHHRTVPELESWMIHNTSTQRSGESQIFHQLNGVANRSRYLRHI